MAVALVTDSTSNIPSELAAARHIHVAPLYILWDEDCYLDGVDLKEPELFQRMRRATTLPKTSQVSVQDFVALFEHAQRTENADEIVCAVISNELSGTYASAIQAAELVDLPVHVVDSRLTTWALGFPMLTGADARDAGASAAEVVAAIERSAQNSHVVFTVESLEHLRRGGRIGQASYLLGSALNIKPILELCDGVVHAADKVRTRKRAVDHLIKLITQYGNGRTVKRLSAIHGDAADEGQKLLEDAVAVLNPQETFLTYAGAVIGVHVGPGVLGLVAEWEN